MFIQEQFIRAFIDQKREVSSKFYRFAASIANVVKRKIYFERYTLQEYRFVSIAIKAQKKKKKVFKKLNNGKDFSWTRKTIDARLIIHARIGSWF